MTVFEKYTSQRISSSTKRTKKACFVIYIFAFLTVKERFFEIKKALTDIPVLVNNFFGKHQLCQNIVQNSNEFFSFLIKMKLGFTPKKLL